VPKAEGELVDFLKDAAYHNVTSSTFPRLCFAASGTLKSKQIPPRDFAMLSANGNGTDSQMQKSAARLVVF
jgi:hypothetical protein